MNGLRVLLLRPEGSSADLCNVLRSGGASVREVPGVAISAGDTAAIDRALEAGGDWAVFLSASAVTHVLDRGSLRFTRIAAVGNATARVLEDAGARCDWTPDVATSAVLARTLPGHGRVTVFRSAAGNTEAEEILRARGFIVTRVDAYRSHAANEQAVADALSSTDAVVLTSASVATTLSRALALRNVSQPLVVTIGPVTTHAAREHTIRVDAEAITPDSRAIMEALQMAITSAMS